MKVHRLILLIIFAVSIGALSEPIPDKDPAFDTYRNFLLNSRTKEAMEELLRVSKAYPGTQIDGLAQLQLALMLDQIGQRDFAGQRLEAIVSTFTGSRIGYLAEANLIDFKFIENEPERWLSETGLLLAKLGVPSIESISTGTAIAPSKPANLSSEEYGRLVCEVLRTVAEFRSGKGDSLSALNIFSYLQLHYSGSGWVDDIGLLLDIRREAADLLSPGQAITNEEDVLPPKIELFSPVSGSRVDSPVKIEIVASDTSLAQSQPNLSKASLSVDDTVVTNFLVRASVSTQTLVYNLSTTQDLPPGPHIASFEIIDYAGNKTKIDFQFIVNAVSDVTKLNSTKDSTLQHRNPHQNEGISPYLTLEKIQGKATRSAVAFDLSDVNLIDLTSATLRLTVDPSQGVNGWGNGDTISALPLSTGWVEGNGQSFGLKKKDQVAGSGSGVTWFSPVDSDISNDYANSTVQWNGGTTGTPTSPLIVMQNHYTGTVDFDVTNDLLNVQGQNGWLIKKDQENRGSKVTFYSREGAAAAGNTDLAPTLILNYGNSTASKNSPGSNLLARLGWNSGTLNLKPANPSSELKNLKQALKDSSTAAFVGDQFLQNATRANPPLHVATAIAYRVWLG